MDEVVPCFHSDFEMFSSISLAWGDESSTARHPLAHSHVSFFGRKEKGRFSFPASSTISLCPVLRENQVRIFQFLIILGIVSVGMQLRCAVCETSSPDLFPAKMETSGTSRALCEEQSLVWNRSQVNRGKKEKATRDTGKKVELLFSDTCRLQPSFCLLDPQSPSAVDVLWNMPRHGTPLALNTNP